MLYTGCRMEKPIYILGINGNIHQSAAVLIKNGVMVAGAEEERFSRKKYDHSLPEQAIEYCLSEAGISLNDVDYAGFYWQPWKGLLLRAWWLVRYFPRSLQMLSADKAGRGSLRTLKDHFMVPRWLRKRGFRGKFYFVDHHTAHAASAFFVSPFNEAAVITTDFCGEACTTMIAAGAGNQLHIRKRFYLPHSLGLFYGALTQYLGYAINADEYRVMGLAPYGTPKYLDIFSKMISFDKGVLRNDNSWFSYHLGGATVFSPKWVATFGPACSDENEVETGEYKHIAASGQKVLEQTLLNVAKWAKEQTGYKNVCLAGGTALNSVANGVLQRSKVFDRMWVQPAAYDPGCALGVCYYIWNQVLRKPRTFTMEHAYWGPAYEEQRMEEAARTHGLACERVENSAAFAARKISEGCVIGWYQGRMEWGPRALGNRSILADARSVETKELVNSKIKFREPYRPFAPAVLEEDAHIYFDIPEESPFMTIVCSVKEEKRTSIPAVTHIDNSARIQTVSKKTNPYFWELLHQFKLLTGESVVLNTSFNVKGEPIVCTPEEAVRCFLKTDMDYLVMGPFVCRRIEGL